MTVVVDASVALKWVLAEAGTDRARALLTATPIIAPDLLWIECANVLWVKARRGQIAPQDARDAIAAINGTPIRAIGTAAISAQALDLAFRLDRPAYDCLYLAAAIEERATLVTADAAFAARAQAETGLADAVRLL